MTGSSAERSEAELRRAIAAGSRDVDDYLGLANLLKSEARNVEARETYQAALRLGLPAKSAARVGWELGEVLQAIGGRRVELVTLASRNLAVLENERSEDSEVTLLRGLNLSLLAQARWGADEELGRDALTEAISFLGRFLSQRPDDEDAPIAQYELARCYRAQGGHQHAVSCCRAYLQRDLTVRDHIYITLGLIHRHQGRGFAGVRGVRTGARRHAASCLAVRGRRLPSGDLLAACRSEV
jgi:tetratricopeptide (TPR) repeat protein